MIRSYAVRVPPSHVQALQHRFALQAKPGTGRDELFLWYGSTYITDVYWTSCITHLPFYLVQIYRTVKLAKNVIMEQRRGSSMLARGNLL